MRIGRNGRISDRLVFVLFGIVATVFEFFLGIDNFLFIGILLFESGTRVDHLLVLLLLNIRRLDVIEELIGRLMMLGLLLLGLLLLSVVEIVILVLSLNIFRLFSLLRIILVLLFLIIRRSSVLLGVVGFVLESGGIGVGGLILIVHFILRVIFVFIVVGVSGIIFSCGGVHSRGVETHFNITACVFIYIF